MVNIIRSAKSSNWDVNELIAYNITVTAVPSQQFFPQEIDVPLTAAGLDPVLATPTRTCALTPMSRATRHIFCSIFRMPPHRILMFRMFVCRALTTSLVRFSLQLASQGVCIVC
ncbi:hypothetical protein BDR06DRAFT_1055042 [Suillus hirtellus]|nr:hypothetical protein BDR06DRAFT_1055042 [Suillus hirtellus]